VTLDIPLNGDVVAFTFLLCLLACAISGVAPAWHMARANLNDALKEGGRSGSGGASSHRIERLLVVSQVALALVAIIGAGLFVRSFSAARQINPASIPATCWYRTCRLTGISSGAEAVCGTIARSRFVAAGNNRCHLLEYGSALPCRPVVGTLGDSGLRARSQREHEIERNVVAPGYFDMLRIPLAEGRDFTDHDDEKSVPVMIVSQAFVRRFFGSRYPIGQHVHGWGRWFNVVGWPRTASTNTWMRRRGRTFMCPSASACARIWASDSMRGPPATRCGQWSRLRRAVRSLDPDAGVFDSMPMAENINARCSPKTGGHYAVCARRGRAAARGARIVRSDGLRVAERRTKSASAIALGARPGDVVRMVVKQGMELTLIGSPSAWSRPSPSPGWSPQRWSKSAPPTRWSSPGRSCSWPPSPPWPATCPPPRRRHRPQPGAEIVRYAFDQSPRCPHP